MGEFILRLWFGAAAVYCIGQVIEVIRGLKESESRIGDASWGIISAYCAIELGALALGIRGPLIWLIRAAH
jgi:hypothetical protein